MNHDDAKSWMLANGECEAIRCPHHVRLAATHDDPAEQDCQKKGACPFDEEFQEWFAARRETCTEDALSEEWDRLLAPLERFIARMQATPRVDHASAYIAAVDLMMAVNGVRDEYTRGVLEARHEL